MSLREVRDAAGVVARDARACRAYRPSPLLAADDVAAMRRANDRFAAATRAGDVDAALRADDELHDVLVRVCGNRALAATIERTRR